jgi:hypothetical protein
MKRVVFTILISGLFISCSLKTTGNKNYIDLGDSQTECETKVFPAQQGRSCPSGEFDHFTIRQITDFGERPVWSPDGKKLAFVEKEFGDIYEIDLETNETTCLTCDFEHPGFLRVHYLKDGDYLLLGPERRTKSLFDPIVTTDLYDRIFKTGFWYMPADRSSVPRWIGEEHFEGVAVSRESGKIAYTKTYLDTPFHFLSVLYVAEVSDEGNIINKKAVYYSAALLEAQDFLPGDKGMTMARYFPTWEAFGYIFDTGKLINYTKNPAQEEPEALFPDGEFMLLECNRHDPDSLFDLYMLRLDGTGKDARRLTHFSDIPGQKANNPAISPEGCRIAVTKTKDEINLNTITGFGLGIFMIEFYECRE